MTAAHGGILRGRQEGQGERPAPCFLQGPPNRPQSKSSANTALLRDSQRGEGAVHGSPKSRPALPGEI